MESFMLKHQEAASVWNLYIASTITMLPGFTFGALLAYSAMAVPQMMVENSTGIVIDLYQASWVVTLMQPTRVCGALATACLQDTFGRKRCLILCSVFQVVGCFLLYLANSYAYLLAAVSFAGMTTGMALLPSYSLLSEMSTIRLRGSLGSLNTLNANGGYLYGMLVSLLLPVQYLPLVTLLPSALFLLVACLLPESPLWLIRKGRVEESRKVVQWLRGSDYSIEPEVKEMEAVISEESGKEKVSILTAFTDRSFLLPFAIICSLFTIQALSGSDTMSYYAITIFAEWDMAPITVALIYQVMITMGYLFSPFVMSRLNTRPQFIAALLISAVAQVGMGLSLIMPCPILSLPCLVVAGLTYGLGVGPVPFVTMSALFPQKYKTYGMSAGQITRAMMVMIQLKAFPYLSSLLGGMGGLFLCHAGALVLGAVFTFAFVPETRNKSLTQLEQIFKKNGNSENKV